MTAVSLEGKRQVSPTMADKDPKPTTAGATASATTAAMLNQPIVIDCGSSSMKAGFAGGAKPKVCCAMHWRRSNVAVQRACLHLSSTTQSHIPSLISFEITKSSKVSIGTKVGRAKHQRVMPGGALEGVEQRRSATASSGKSRSHSLAGGGVTSYFVGRTLDDHRGAFLLDYPMERGRVVDGGWEALELIWEVRSDSFLPGLDRFH